MIKRIAVGILSLVMIFLCGCENGSKTVSETEGTTALVTYDSAPETEANSAFETTSTENETATASESKASKAEKTKKAASAVSKTVSEKITSSKTSSSAKSKTAESAEKKTSVSSRATIHKNSVSKPQADNKAKKTTTPTNPTEPTKGSDSKPQSFYGILIDEDCSDFEDPPTHDLPCMLMDSCRASGYGLDIRQSDGSYKFIMFDGKGQELSWDYLNKTTRMYGLYVTVTGTYDNGIIKVKTLKES